MRASWLVVPCLGLAVLELLGGGSPWGSTVTGCAMPTAGGSDAGAAPATADDGGIATPPGATGSDCAVDPTSHVTLCSSISTCPGLAVDHDVYPDCGFRIQGSVLDLECLCSGALCPVGVPTTCAEARQLLAQQTQVDVCTQVSEGRCSGGSSGPTSDAGAGGCDEACASQCAGDPGCIKICGC